MTDPNSSARQVAVIGGGIAGLSAAYHLGELAAAREFPIEVTLLERGTRVGGAMETIRRDGYVIETGSDSLLSEKPAAIELARRVGLADELIPTRPGYRKTYVVRAGRLVEIPAGFALLAPARIAPILWSPLFSVRGKLRMALEPFIPARRDGADESLASFVTRRLGREVLDRVAQPLAGGIYTADPDRLSINATMPRFVEMERRYGSLMKGLRAAEAARPSAGGPASGARWSLFMSFKRGVGALPEALAARLGGSIRQRTEVVAMTRDGDRWRLDLDGGGRLAADAVICAAPAPAAARILSAVAPQAAGLLREITYAAAATVNLAYRESDFPSLPDAFGFVVPAAERRKIIAGSFSSFKYEGRSPAGMILVRAFVGGVMQSAMLDLGEDEIVAGVCEEFHALLGVSAPPQFSIVRRWPAAMPQYEVGHLARIAQLERLLAAVPAFAAAGAAYHGVGVPDCVRSGEQASEAIFATLRGAG